ncbi:unnamed protein product [Brachionus calyciflorus]|uniref:Uncharacterized protein n=1 Tax=Brachionus calyciflorus TaxID=104777 RepID=A0A814HGY1_9BILA|nr:unnamed protein product [Brachionus calyciflorus]
MLLILFPLLFFFGTSHTWHCSEQCMVELRNDVFCYKTDSPINIDEIKTCFFSIYRTTRIFHIEASKRDYNVKEIYDFNFVGKTVTIFQIYDTFLHTMPNVSKLNIENFALKRTGLAILDRNNHLPDTLEYMDLSENSITFIKEDFFIKFQNLKEIILSKNFFVQIDLIVFNSNTLYLIDLSHNTHLNELNEIKFITSPKTDSLEIHLHENSLKKVPYLTGISKMYLLKIGKQHEDFLYSNNSLLFSRNSDQIFEIQELIISMHSIKATNLSLEYLCFIYSNRFMIETTHIVDITDFKTLHKFNINESDFADGTRTMAIKGSKVFRRIHAKYTSTLFSFFKNYCRKYMLEFITKTTTSLKKTTTLIKTQAKTNMTTTKSSSITTKITTSSTKIKTTSTHSTTHSILSVNTTIQILTDIFGINSTMQEIRNEKNIFRNRILDYFMDNVSQIVVIFTFIFASLLGIFFGADLAIKKGLKLRKRINT